VRARVGPAGGLLDTSVIVGRSRPELDESAISAITLAEVHYGVLKARTGGERAVRLRLLALVESEFDPLPIDSDVARAYGATVAGARAETNALPPGPTRSRYRSRISPALRSARSSAEDRPRWRQHTSLRVRGAALCQTQPAFSGQSQTLSVRLKCVPGGQGIRYGTPLLHW
jgi:hypothetical protein